MQGLASTYMTKKTCQDPVTMLPMISHPHAGMQPLLGLNEGHESLIEAIQLAGDFGQTVENNRIGLSICQTNS